MWGQAWTPHPHTRTWQWTQSGACMRTFLDMDCGLTSAAEMAQEHEGLPQGPEDMEAQGGHVT